MTVLIAGMAARLVVATTPKNGTSAAVSPPDILRRAGPS